MINHLIKVTAAIPGLKVADITYNTDRIIEMIEGLSDSGLIVFPELSVTGYTCADLFNSDLLLKKALDSLIRIAKETSGKGYTVLVGVPIRFKNCIYNCAALLSRGEIKALIPKTYLPNYSEFYECRWFASGKDIKS